MGIQMTGTTLEDNTSYLILFEFMFFFFRSACSSFEIHLYTPVSHSICRLIHHTGNLRISTAKKRKALPIHDDYITPR